MYSRGSLQPALWTRKLTLKPSYSFPAEITSEQFHEDVSSQRQEERTTWIERWRLQVWATRRDGTIRFPPESCSSRTRRLHFVKTIVSRPGLRALRAETRGSSSGELSADEMEKKGAAWGGFTAAQLKLASVLINLCLNEQRDLTLRLKMYSQRYKRTWDFVFSRAHE